ncbi:MAG TPA: shikimate dehydrogenase, partial [Hyphomicrobiales bacterium]|nr:shikimate dehydrogenase [Hyphomicrobiales bacterium]
RVLILGAGGATRGIVLPLLRQTPAELVIANRTVAKAEALQELFAEHGPVQACGFADLAGQRFDWVINATAASLQGELPPLPADLLAPGAWCCDLMYAAEPTVFCRWAQAHGAAKALDGLGMLVEQAAEAFLLWRGVRPETGEVLRRLRQAS